MARARQPTQPEAPPEPERTRSSGGKCPVCNGILYQLGEQLYCPDEDAHVGGLIVYADGSYRSMIRTSIHAPVDK